MFGVGIFGWVCFVTAACTNFIHDFVPVLKVSRADSHEKHAIANRIINHHHVPCCLFEVSTSCHNGCATVFLISTIELHQDFKDPVHVSLFKRQSHLSRKSFQEFTQIVEEQDS